MKNLSAFALVVLLFSAAVFSQQSDAALRTVIEKDKSSRDLAGKLVTLTAAEHLSRGQTYFDNRHFPESREHFQKIFDNYAADPAMSGALFMTGRSYYWERQYAKAIPYLDRVSREFPATKDGREGLSFKGACNVRLGKNFEAAKIYEQYTVMYPAGERIDGAYLNIIDALREAGKYDDANAWVEKTRLRFAGMPTETSALQGRLRMEIYRGRWADAIATADTMLATGNFAGSMTGADEIKYLKAFALEKSGRRGDAIAVYSSIPDSSASYYSGLAGDRLTGFGARVNRIVQITPKLAQDYPAAFRTEVLQEAKKRRLDPRLCSR